MADIYTMDGDEITVGLQGSSVCDEAINAAFEIAENLGETVRLEDDDGSWDVHPNGEAERGESWD